MSDDLQLLTEYARNRSEAAFAQLVERYLPLVYSAARRQVGEAAAAQDAAQQVFILLAEKANKLSGVHLSGWLHQATRNICANARRK